MIPLGTTARQIEKLARWMLASAIVLSALAWWWPSYSAWGMLSIVLLVVLGLWLISGIVRGKHVFAANGVYIVFAIPILLLIYHSVHDMLAAGATDPWTSGGAIDLSLLFHFIMLALGIMLAQAILPRAASHAMVLRVCGAAIVCGAAAAMVWGNSQQVRNCLALFAHGGIGIWLAPLWGTARIEGQREDAFSRTSARWLKAGYVATAAGAAAVLAMVAPMAALIAAAITSATLVVASAVFRQHRKMELFIASILALGCAAVWFRLNPQLGVLRKVPAGPFGRGEIAFTNVFAGDSGLVVLGAVIGWVGLMWLVGGLVVLLVWLMGHARRGHRGDKGLAVVWTATTALMFASLLAPGGLSIPAVTLAVAFTLGLMPTMLGRRPRRWPGVLLMVPLTIIMLMLGLPVKLGLAGWITGALGLADYVMHAVIGLMLMLALCWLMGARSLWFGLIAMLISVLIGGAGELLQRYASLGRAGQWSDFAADVVGSTAGFVLYLLARGARWWESPEVTDLRNDPYLY